MVGLVGWLVGSFREKSIISIKIQGLSLTIEENTPVEPILDSESCAQLKNVVLMGGASVPFACRHLSSKLVRILVEKRKERL